MELDGIGTKGSMAYADMARQKVAVTPKPAPEPAKKVSVSTSTTGNSNEAAVVQEDENISRKVKDAIDKVSDKMHMAKTKCEFSYHEKTKSVSIKVIDEDTDEVIREIPPEETLEMLTKMWELAGILVDEKR